MFLPSKTAVTLLTLHASLCVFLAILAGHLTHKWLDLPFVTIMSLNYYFINPIITVATIVAFEFQAGTARETRRRSALSRTTLMLQAFIFLALAVLWPFKFKVPHRMSHSYRGHLWLLEKWYPHVGGTCVNNAVIEIGQVIVLYVLSGRADSGLGPNGEKQALLTT
jgi:hypothetical protein